MADPTIGELRTRVELQSRTETPNAATGGIDETFTTLATVWARVDAISGGRYIAGQQVETVATHRVTLRSRSDFQSIKFLRWNGRRFRVRAWRDLDQVNRFDEALVEELASGV